MDNLEQLIRDGQRMDAIQKEPVFQAALDRARTRAYQEFLKGKTDDERRTAWAKAHAIENLEEEIRITIDRGVTAKVEADRASRPRTSR